MELHSGHWDRGQWTEDTGQWTVESGHCQLKAKIKIKKKKTKDKARLLLANSRNEVEEKSFYHGPKQMNTHFYLHTLLTVYFGPDPFIHFEWTLAEEFHISSSSHLFLKTRTPDSRSQAFKKCRSIKIKQKA